MQTATEHPHAAATPIGAAKTPRFGVNEMRLGVREWLATLAIVLACFVAIPRLWKKAEPLKTDADYRVPYALSKDYWLFQRRLEQDVKGDKIAILGDSVVWGEYVRPDGTLSHFLNERYDSANAPDDPPQGSPPDPAQIRPAVVSQNRFLNCGINGMFPLAMEGLVRDYAKVLHDRKVIVQCNVLWMTSPKADLSEDKEEDFNHAALVPQFTLRIPSYRADANARLSAVIGRHVQFFQWADHLQIAYYDQHSIPQWTLEDDGGDPPKYPNAWKNPLTPLRHGIPGEGAKDPLRGPSSPRHKPWNADGAEPTDFEWVDIDSSLQWQAFNRVVHLLKDRGNDVLVILGPFNEHMIADDQLAQYRKLHQTIIDRLTRDGFTVVAPPALPSSQYADASHPLTAGYAMLARKIAEDGAFNAWLAKK
ncbi:MAG TPA: hypothetical protein VFE47_08625 [Tepidisphaeraceae bacterium]|jgi:hypothetical protein|nr:hypothetical protein [Tepidisphaeraceae bacterium]